MVKETVHIVQPYWEDKRKGLIPAEVLPVRSVDAAHERAKRLFDTGNYAGRGRLHHHRRRGDRGVRGARVSRAGSGKCRTTRANR